MASPSELSLDCKPHSYSMLLKSFGEHQQQYPDQTLKLEDFLSRLEEERVKIDAFKRELPLCMQLLTNAVESSRQQLQAYRGNNNTAINQGPTRPILEEFIPLKTSNSEVSEKTTNTSDKANWMTSAQLWSQSSTTTTTITHQENATKQLIQSTTSGVVNKTKDHQSPQNDHISFNVMSPKLTLDTKIQRNNGGGAFLPFSKDRAGSCPRPLPELALAALAEKEGDLEDKKSCLETNIIICGTNNNGNNNSNGVVVTEQGKVGVNNLPEGQTNINAANNNNNNNNNNNSNNSTNNGSITQTSNNNNNNNTNNNQTHRKARRCWSPDLHRRFVSALQMLGGSQVATPKQIRELMKVEGLTNDEVKSHLQKYRLHTRRPSPSPQAAGGPAPQLVVLGGIWVPPEYTHGAGPTAAAIYSPHAPPHYCGPPPPVPQDHFYSAGQPLAHHHHHHTQLMHHQQLHVYSKGSPESEVRGGPRGDRSSESIEEDGKSESSSWNKADSGERKGLAALRDDVADQESNGSEITLKF